MSSNPTMAAAPANEPGRFSLYLRAFGGLLLRDLRVLLREVVPFVLRTVIQPLLFVFVFTYVFPKIGQGFSGGSGGASFATILVPGLVAVAIFFAGISAVALPLSIELGRTHEIEDRLMAPVPVTLVAAEKILFSMLQCVLSAAVVFPIVYLVPATPVSVDVHSWPLLIAVVLLASLASSSLGLALGTVVKPEQISLFFGVLITPLIFLGGIYYPWATLEPVRWLQIAVLLNPLVYVCEGLRAALTPGLPHMSAWAFLGALAALTIALTVVGVRGFVRRVLS